MHLVFVYGTLKRGFANYDEWMMRFKYSADGITCDKFPLVIGGAYFSPILLSDNGQGHMIKGELFELDDDGLATLDMIEGVGKENGYKRIAIQVISDARNVLAWTYVKDRTTVDVIHNELNCEYQQDERYIPAAQR